jgi:hypothetical protein
MKLSLVILLAVFPSWAGSGSCQKHDAAVSVATSTANNDSNNNAAVNNIIRINVGSATFTATLADNDAAKAFSAMLPMTVSMTDLHGNEKYFDFSASLPTNTVNPGTINSGDLMLWGSKTLVLFYKTFPTSYSYTRLGKIDDPTGLAEAVGAGNITVTYNLE